jgi:uncharacterized protein YdaU (DUF1376 family)
MNFYPFHIGDYAAHTKHLSLIEDLAYRRLLDLYYTSEKPLPEDPKRVARLIGMRDHLQEVSDVLSDFFTISEQGHINKRCDDEILKYQGKAARAIKANESRYKSKNPIKSDVNSDTNSDVNSDALHIPTNNQEPITNNQIKEKKASPSKSPGKPDTVAPENWEAWLQVRKAKKAPLTNLAMKATQREADKAGITLDDAIRISAEKNWINFNSTWNWNDQPTQTETFYQADQRAKRKQWEQMTGRQWPTETPQVIDMGTVDADFLRIEQ